MSESCQEFKVHDANHLWMNLQDRDKSSVGILMTNTGFGRQYYPLEQTEPLPSKRSVTQHQTILPSTVMSLDSLS